MEATKTAEDGKVRCKWSIATPEFITYHDDEWGMPAEDDNELFEKLCLESFQSGLSWKTILAKRDNFRLAFDNFNVEKVAKFAEADVHHLLNNEGIVRHQGKILAAINNAKCSLAAAEEYGSLTAYFWRFVLENENVGMPNLEIADKLSKALKKRGWKFVGSTTIYAFMQASGLINDHAVNCIAYDRVQQARKQFVSSLANF